MTGRPGSSAGPDISSFSEFLRAAAPDRLPGSLRQAQGAIGGAPGAIGPAQGAIGPAQGASDAIPHGTTIVAVAYPGGVVLAGDRRSTMGNLIATRDVQKVFVTDDHSAAGIAGTAGIAFELVKLFTVELEHYEKIEGVPLTLDGKVSRLATMVRGNLSAAMQGLAALPLLVGVDPGADPAAPGRIFTFDVAGARHEEHAGYDAIGSGSVFARSSLKKLYRPGVTASEALALAVEALYDAADDDSATGGPDLIRRIFPTAVRVETSGAVEIGEPEIAAAAQAVIARRSADHRTDAADEEQGR
ncbi:proteasome subunit beta [Gordonia sp. (in: high G+C Gram-positive bacteria)]|uniref:proteasome subunit beta n=1 Tax=Gordonia sp. (in: high G+C Gram-positive bacteria) TaxID=84139 RepID=UPI00261C6C4D|nr:proteasome subunit beta [Gordonia sp. (in: high G+C Gram-positive bacteria)]